MAILFVITANQQAYKSVFEAPTSEKKRYYRDQETVCLGIALFIAVLTLIGVVFLEAEG